ncbi:MAG: hypothetical protein U1F68_04910 [Gammaproteobacteria bacterium]
MSTHFTAPTSPQEATASTDAGIDDTGDKRDQPRAPVEIPMPVNPDQPSGDDYPPDPLPIGDPPADKPEIHAGAGTDVINDGAPKGTV